MKVSPRQESKIEILNPIGVTSVDEVTYARGFLYKFLCYIRSCISLQQPDDLAKIIMKSHMIFWCLHPLFGAWDFCLTDYNVVSIEGFLTLGNAGATDDLEAQFEAQQNQSELVQYLRRLKKDSHVSLL